MDCGGIRDDWGSSIHDLGEVCRCSPDNHLRNYMYCCLPIFYNEILKYFEIVKEKTIRLIKLFPKVTDRK